MVVFDNTVLSLLLHPDVDVPNNPKTGEPIERAQDRVMFLVEQLQENGTRILIPAPVVAEFLTFASTDYLTTINQSMWFEVAPFDQRAAVEAAVAIRLTHCERTREKARAGRHVAENQNRPTDRRYSEGQ